MPFAFTAPATDVGRRPPSRLWPEPASRNFSLHAIKSREQRNEMLMRQFGAGRPNACALHEMTPCRPLRSPPETGCVSSSVSQSLIQRNETTLRRTTSGQRDLYLALWPAVSRCAKRDACETGGRAPDTPGFPASHEENRGWPAFAGHDATVRRFHVDYLGGLSWRLCGVRRS
jgi:hypothetical protein